MKTIKIKDDGKEYKIAENAGDLNIVRLIILKNIITENSAGMDYPDLLQWFSERKTFYNQNDIHALLTHEINMMRRIQQMGDSPFTDSAQQIFALMVLEEGEHPHEYDKTQGQEKLARMSEEGLTQGEVWSYVSNFMIESPQIYRSFFPTNLLEKAIQKIMQESPADSTLNTQEPKQQ